MPHKDTSKHRRKQTVPSLAGQREEKLGDAGFTSRNSQMPQILLAQRRKGRKEKNGTQMNTDERGFLSSHAADMLSLGVLGGLGEELFSRKGAKGAKAFGTLMNTDEDGFLVSGSHRPLRSRLMGASGHRGRAAKMVVEGTHPQKCRSLAPPRRLTLAMAAACSHLLVCQLSACPSAIQGGRVMWKYLERE